MVFSAGIVQKYIGENVQSFRKEWRGGGIISITLLQLNAEFKRHDGFPGTHGKEPHFQTLNEKRAYKLSSKAHREQSAM